MKWNSVTWYSKLLAMILFVSLPFIGFYLGTRFDEATKPAKNENLDKIQEGYTTIVDTDEISVEIKNDNGLLLYKGRAQAPDSCNYLLSESTFVSSENKIPVLKIDVKKKTGTTQTCVQVISDLQFSGSIETASSNLTIYFNDQKL